MTRNNSKESQKKILKDKIPNINCQILMKNRYYLYFNNFSKNYPLTNKYQELKNNQFLNQKVFSMRDSYSG